MSAQLSNVQLVTNLYEAYGRGDLDTIRSYLAPDVVMTQPEQLPWGDRYLGPDGFFEFLGKLNGYVDAKLDVEDVFDAGDTVVEVGHTVGTVRANGAQFRARESHLITLRDGQIVRFQVLVDVPAMLAAVNA
ncbi:nuclear transport factor 2 family protein [Kribbella sp. NPDC056345]|uniref:nuclear transport factor 2 family protein n=1 Tax=Kribbella sp. NPDC056345 TaxID=3345789 RepID=UPI0035DE5AD3